MTGDNRTPDRVDDVFVQLSHPRRRAIMLLVAAAGGRGVDLRAGAVRVGARLERPPGGGSFAGGAARPHERRFGGDRTEPRHGYRPQARLGSRR